jgi:hypothetical protein
LAFGAEKANAFSNVEKICRGMTKQFFVHFSSITCAALQTRVGVVLVSISNNRNLTGPISPPRVPDAVPGRQPRRGIRIQPAQWGGKGDS